MNLICLLQIMHISSSPHDSLGSGLYRPETEAASDGTVTGSCMIFFSGPLGNRHLNGETLDVHRRRRWLRDGGGR